MIYKNFPCKIVEENGLGYIKGIIPEFDDQQMRQKAIVHINGKNIPRLISSRYIAGEDQNAIKLSSMIYDNIILRNEEKPKGEAYEELTFKISKIDNKYQSKKDNSIRPMITVKTNKNNAKFWLSDCEIVYPSLKGFNFPVDKTIKAGDPVKYAKNKEDYIVKKIIRNSTSRDISRSSMNSALDVLHIAPINGGKIIKDYCKYFKKITNVNTNTEKEISKKTEQSNLPF